MNGTLSTSQSYATKTDVQTTVLDWIQAIEEFHRNYFTINKVLAGWKPASQPMSVRATVGSRRIKNLIKLRAYMNDVLQTLLLDMTKSTVMPFCPNDSTSSSKAGQLVTHAQLLDEINRKIYKELAYFTTAQA